jgi:mRNA-degrading endonuclease toxin of MazEF toxin-antitoxin module
MLSDPYDTGPYLQWEIRDVFWQHEDGTDKRRKALLISDDEYNKTNLFLRFLKFSTRNRPSPYRIPILRTDQEWAHMKFTKECFLYVDKSQRIPKSKVSKPTGHVGIILGSKILLLLKKIEQDDQGNAGAKV